MKHINFKKNGGFTLIELMITVSIVAILSAIAFPSYNAYVLRSNRAEARNALLQVAQRLEQTYAITGRYNTTQAAGGALGVPDIADATIATWGLSTVPPGGNVRYNITFNGGAPGISTFTLLATPVGAQTADTGCGVLMLDERNIKGALGVLNNRAQATLDCWRR